MWAATIIRGIGCVPSVFACTECSAFLEPWLIAHCNCDASIGHFLVLFQCFVLMPLDQTRNAKVGLEIAQETEANAWQLGKFSENLNAMEQKAG